MNIAAGSLLFSLATLISRFFGLARDISLAAVYGGSWVLDAYFVSIIIPFFMRKIFGEGAIGSSFVPYYKTSKDKNAFASAVLNVFGIVSILSAVLIWLGSDLVLKVFAPGFDENQMALAGKLLGISVLFIPEVFVWAVFYSILNSHGEYFLPALTPLFMNLGVIIGTLLGKDPFWSVVGFVSGGAAAAGLLALRATRYFEYSFTLSLPKEFYGAFFKALGAVMVNQLNLLVDTAVATTTGEGGVSVIQLASRLYQLPMGLFVVAVSTVSLAEMSGTGEEKLKESMTTALVFSLPAFAGLVAMPFELTGLVYSFGRFQGEVIKTTAQTLLMYSLGIVPYSIYMVGVRFHHSRKNMTTPLVFSVIVSGTNALLDLVLAKYLGPSGIALATTIAGIIGALLVAFSGAFEADLSEIAKSAAAAGVVATVLLVMKGLHNGKIWYTALVILGIALYLLMLSIMKSKTLKEVLRYFSRTQT